MFEADIQRAASAVRSSRYAVALTGAGISTPSGIPDFRSAESGLWERANPFEVATFSGFTRNPAAFYDWLRPLARDVLQAQPNPAHCALAQLEEMGWLKALITQNIDMLHTRAGSQTVYEVHGHIREVVCALCGEAYNARPYIEALLGDEAVVVPLCPVCGGPLKPAVVLFGEALPARAIEAAYEAAERCDLMIVAGASLRVAPVSDLPRVAAWHGAKLVIINYEPTYIDRRADVVIHADVAEVLPGIVAALAKNE
jgi:NAD-dependent deacetylase